MESITLKNQSSENGSKLITLKLFEELIGSLKGFEYDEAMLLIQLGSFQTVFNLEPITAEDVIKKLTTFPKGTLVAILRVTNNKILVREMMSNK